MTYGKATHPTGLHAVPDCQRAEAYQAHDTPTIWGTPGSPLTWRAFGWTVAALWVAGLSYFAPLAMHWPVAWRVAVAVPVAVMGVVATWRLTR